jgi:hypothetical protein
MSRVSGTVVAAVLLVAPLSAQWDLPVDSRGSGVTTDSTPARFAYTPAGPGVLTVVVNATDDVGIRLVDADGQLDINGSVDSDHNGQPGLEVLSIPLGYAEPVFVEVHLLSEQGGGGAFSITATFIAEPAFGQPDTPDRRPSEAKVIAVGSVVNESLDPEMGDSWNWYAITAAEAMTVVVATRTDTPDSGDLAMAAYLDDDYANSVAWSDLDRQGNPGSESFTIDLEAGQTVHVKVSSLYGTGARIAFKLAVGRVP